VIELVRELYPLNRTLISADTDKALAIIGQHMPTEAGYRIEEIPCGTECWTWTVPKRWVCDYAVLQVHEGCGVRTILSATNNPLHVVSYSRAIALDGVPWDELAPHLHYSEDRPAAIPFRFDGYYKEAWGFCLPKQTYDSLPRDKRYRVTIRSRFLDAPGLKVGVGIVGANGAEPQHGTDSWTRRKGEVVVCAHVDHPAQANDDASGVAVAVELANRLAANPLPDDALRVRFLFCPERIGSIAWLHENAPTRAHTRAGLFLEMCGTDGPIRLVRARGGTINRIALRCLEIACGEPYGSAPSNDEQVFNAPGIDIPMISLSRWPYPEYHTSDDTPDILSEDKLRQMADVAERIVRIAATDYTPKRTFTGPLFLSKYDLWVDWRTDWDLNRAIDKMTHLLEGDLTVFEIAEQVGLDYWVARDWIDKLVAHELAVKI
jgi:aminopeptidase-like protein